MVNKNPRGLRVNMPSGYIIGRASKGSGRAELISVKGLMFGSGFSGSPGSIPSASSFVLFGSGDPTVAGEEGMLYFDTTDATYAGWVYHLGAWHPFLSASHAPTIKTTTAWFFMLGN